MFILVDMRSTKRTIGRREIRDAIAFGAAIMVIGASFGALAAAAEVPPELIVGLSVLVFAGGSQFLVVAVVAAGGSPVAAVLAAFLLNARHLPFGLAMADVVGSSRLAKLVGAHILIDESVAFAKARGGGPAARPLYWLMGGTAFVSWNIGTLLGMLGGAAVPDPAAFGVDAAFPAGLLALLLPSLRRPDALRVGVAAGLLALLATPLLPAGVPVLLGLLGLAAAGRPTPPTAEKVEDEQ